MTTDSTDAVVVKDDRGIKRVLDRMYIQRHRQHQALYAASTTIPEDSALTDEEARIMERGYRYWFRPPILDQGSEGACTGFGAASCINAGPTRPKTLLTAADAFKLYEIAKENDEWPGTDYEGSSVNGAMVAARKLGYVVAFHWAREINTVIRGLALRGPFEIGVDWTETMMRPVGGWIRATGPVVGGHAVGVVGINWKTEFRISKGGPWFRGYLLIPQSWGKRHGLNGFVKLPLEDFAKLLDGIEFPGDACLPVERIAA